MWLTEQLDIFKSLFKGREDIFAVRWENGAKSGYMPAYHYDPYRFRLHQAKGGTFQNYSEKEYLRLTDEQLGIHLNGAKQIGVYPLLIDNSSWFIAADFDEENWKESCIALIKECSGKNMV